MDYSIAYAIENVLHFANQHRWMAFSALVLFLLAIFYNVIRRQYEPRKVKG